MNKDRVEGAAKQAVGGAKEVVGKAVGNTRLTADGLAEKIEGKVQSTIGGAKDALRS